MKFFSGDWVGFFKDCVHILFAVLFGMLPISEMSFVLIQQGRSLEAISNDTYSLILNVTILSMLLGPLGAALTQPVYRWFRKLVPERVQPLREVDWSEPEPNEVLIAGGGRFSAELAETLIGIGRRCRVIEPQHQEFEEARDRRLPVLFGAGEDTIPAAAWALWYLVVSFPLVGLARFSCSYFCAVGEPLAGGILAYGEPLAAQPLFLFTLPLWLSLEGVWVAYPAAVMLTAAAAFVLMRRHLALLPARE